MSKALRILRREHVVKLMDRLAGNDPKLVQLKISGVDIGSGGLADLAVALASNRTLQSLKLGRIKSGEDDVAEGFATVVEAAVAPRDHAGREDEEGGRGGGGIERLSLVATGLGDDLLGRVAPALCASSLRGLVLKSDAIGPRGAEILAEVLRSNDGLRMLNMRGNELGDAGAKSILGALGEGGNRTVEEVLLADNGVGPDGARAAGEALGVNSALFSLDLAHNDLGDNGAEGIADGLRSDACRLGGLHLSKCKIGTPGFISLASALEVNSTLLFLQLEKNELDKRAAKQVAASLLKNNSLREFGLRNCKIGGNGSHEIKKAVFGWRLMWELKKEKGKGWKKKRKITWDKIQAQRNADMKVEMEAEF